MKTFILAAALTVTALVGIAQAQTRCTTTCSGWGAGRSCTTYCW
jgi:hypothetical protein